MNDKTSNMKPLAKPQVALVENPGDSLQAARRIAAMHLFGSTSRASQHKAAMAIDCGKLSGLCLIAEIEGLDAVMTLSHTKAQIRSNVRAIADETSVLT